LFRSGGLMSGCLLVLTFEHHSEREHSGMKFPLGRNRTMPTDAARSGNASSYGLRSRRLLPVGGSCRHLCRAERFVAVVVPTEPRTAGEHFEVRAGTYLLDEVEENLGLAAVAVSEALRRDER
jgi:hypothetical protein